VPKVGRMIEQMEASGELAGLRETLIKQVLSGM
jgi:polar amino acid transport system substrate-binding protein